MSNVGVCKIASPNANIVSAPVSNLEIFVLNKILGKNIKRRLAELERQAPVSISSSEHLQSRPKQAQRAKKIQYKNSPLINNALGSGSQPARDPLMQCALSRTPPTSNDDGRSSLDKIYENYTHSALGFQHAYLPNLESQHISAIADNSNIHQNSAESNSMQGMRWDSSNRCYSSYETLLSN